MITDFSRYENIHSFQFEKNHSFINNDWPNLLHICMIIKITAKKNCLTITLFNALTSHK